MDYIEWSLKQKKRRRVWWNISISSGVVALIYANIEHPDVSNWTGAFCCGSIIFAILALSTKVERSQVVLIQQKTQFTPIPSQITRGVPEKPDMFAKTKEMWGNEAKNLELARNWEGAAKAYEKAGSYAEAGRIRQEHLEQKQPIVQIGQVKNTVLNDSVMITEEEGKD